MKIIKCEQGTPAWFAARLGKPTASKFGCIVTPTGRPVTGAARGRYMYELLGERITGETANAFVTPAMERGALLELEANGWYQLSQDRYATAVGFVTDDSSRWGCSPDGLVDDDGGLEIKCPMTANFLSHYVEDCQWGRIPSEYIVQVQACLWVTGRAWWDFVLYSDRPNMPNTCIRVEPDATMHEAFEDQVPRFCQELDALTHAVCGG